MRLRSSGHVQHCIGGAVVHKGHQGLHGVLQLVAKGPIKIKITNLQALLITNHRDSLFLVTD